jgi:glucosamine--fructose-6-phosphate aminotransferase (isomerizing)
MGDAWGGHLANTHPHRAGRVAVVHNGIIENFRELRAELSAKGIGHETDTDTETVAILFEDFLDQGLSPQQAAPVTIAKLKGAYALCFLIDGQEDLMIVARMGSPLAIGHGDNEMYVGSDALALAPMTSRITYLEEGDWATITRAGAEIYDKSGNRANRELREIRLETAAADNGGYSHFMAKEINEQPTVLGNAVSHYLAKDRKSIQLSEGMLDFTKIDGLVERQPPCPLATTTLAGL